MKLFPNKSKMLNLLKIMVLLCLMVACSDDESNFPFGTKVNEVKISASTKDTIINVLVGNAKVPIYLAVPDNCTNPSFPAVVVLHGSGGMWKNDDPNSGEMSSQFKEWRDILASNCIVGAFVDSYSGRGVTERTGKWTKAPDNFRISAQFVRPADANAALEQLKQLKFSDGSLVVRAADIGILGFSDGGTALAATLYDTETTPNGWEWTQSFDGKEYDKASGVLPPAPKPKEGFAGGVFYYGGSSGFGYWGTNACNDDANVANIYFPYAPILYQIPEKGYLTDTNLCMYTLLKDKGANVELIEYQNVGHGFDTDENFQSQEARQNTINWFKEILHMN